jgi:hypothetical protein
VRPQYNPPYRRSLAADALTQTTFSTGPAALMAPQFHNQISVSLRDVTKSVSWTIPVADCGAASAALIRNRSARS